jgi:hypothetical protein
MYKKCFLLRKNNGVRSGNGCGGPSRCGGIRRQQHGFVLGPLLLLVFGLLRRERDEREKGNIYKIGLPNTCDQR